MSEKLSARQEKELQITHLVEELNPIPARIEKAVMDLYDDLIARRKSQVIGGVIGEFQASIKPDDTDEQKDSRLMTAMNNMIEKLTAEKQRRSDPKIVTAGAMPMVGGVN